MGKRIIVLSVGREREREGKGASVGEGVSVHAVCRCRCIWSVRAQCQGGGPNRQFWSNRLDRPLRFPSTFKTRDVFSKFPNTFENIGLRKGSLNEK